MSDVHVRRDGKPATASDPTLSGQQMQAMAKQYGDELGKIRKDVELRKLALDQACNLVSFNGADPIDLARKIHAFLIEGANDQK